MKIRVLCENTSLDERYDAEHGLSLLIETKKHTVLFDAGQSDCFLRNAEKLNISPEKIDTVILSHGHYDHGNGIPELLSRNSCAKVYIRKEAFEKFYHGEKYIGLSDRITAFGERIHFVKGQAPFIIDEELTLFSARALPSAPPSPLCENEHPDPFDHEQYLLITEGDHSAFLTGCAHRGIGAIAQYAKQQGATHLLGGFHLPDPSDPNRLNEIASMLVSLELQYYTGHCTGTEAYRFLSERLQKRLHRLTSGLEFVIGDHAEKACFLFRQGYNCSQSVFGAFAEDFGIELPLAMRIACSFGGGMGRLRETCGAVSGMLLVCGMQDGYATPETGTVKAEHYRTVQALVNTFRAQNGSIQCRELLGGTASTSPIPTARTPDFYKTRPCERCIASAARIAEEKLFAKN